MILQAVPPFTSFYHIAGCKQPRGKNTLSAYGAAISCSPDWQQAKSWRVAPDGGKKFGGSSQLVSG